MSLSERVAQILVLLNIMRLGEATNLIFELMELVNTNGTKMKQTCTSMDSRKRTRAANKPSEIRFYQISTLHPKVARVSR